MDCESRATRNLIMFIKKVEMAAKKSHARVMKTATRLLSPEDLGDRKGGYFCLKIFGYDFFLIRPMLVNEVTNGKDRKYIDFSQEKAGRLESQRKINGHVSSFQSQDPEQDRWPGAILGYDGSDHEYAFSFSGLPWKCDEAISLLTAVEVECLTIEEAIRTAGISGNDIFMAVIEGTD